MAQRRVLTVTLELDEERRVVEFEIGPKVDACSLLDEGLMPHIIDFPCAEGVMEEIVDDEEGGGADD